MCVFFFFKQKTAYEMRISDWSSDVCSSDLARDAQTVNGSVKAGDDIEAEDLGTVNGDICVGERARISGGIETVNGGIFVGRGGNVAKGIETEIGRASCRERVCQYV